MIITATEAQNNFGKYLKICRHQNVIITRNGIRVALLVPFPPGAGDSEICETIYTYGTSPRKDPGWVTYSKFMEICENSENRYELIDGKVYLLASPNVMHQRILGKMYISFAKYFEKSDGCDAFMAPFDIKVVRYENREEPEEDLLEFFTNVVQPDLLVICDYEDDINDKGKYDGVATLVVEILSPSNRKKDMIKKLEMYSDTGIEEYWEVDPESKTVAVYRFGEEDLESNVTYFSSQVAESVRFPGLAVPLGDLF